jgi:MATE family multidrug resistance protein
VLALALPLIISTGSWSIMNFIDRMFLLWSSPEEMAAAMPAGILYFTVICIPFGVSMYVNTFVAQYHGAGRPERIGLVVWQGMRIGLYLTPLFLLTIPFAPAVFAAAGHSADVAPYEVVYYQTLCFCATAQVIAAATSSFFTGRGRTRVVMTVDVAASALNVLLDYLWIFGYAGFPRWGIEGAAWATVVSQWFRVVVYWWLMMRPAHQRRYALDSGRRFDARLMLRLWRFGGPNGWQLVMEVAAFAGFLLLVGGLGKAAMAATTLAFNINSVAWVPLWGMGIAVTTMVGQELGRDRPQLAARATWTSFTMAQAYLCTMALLYVVVPDLFLIGHAAGTSPEKFDRLRDLTVVLLRFVAAYSLLDAANILFVSAIKGAGDTRFVLVITSLMAPLPVLGCLGVFAWLEEGHRLTGCWAVITVWICALAVIYLLRFLQGRWRTMRVIEPAARVEPDEAQLTAEPAEACAAHAG